MAHTLVGVITWFYEQLAALVAWTLGGMLDEMPVLNNPTIWYPGMGDDGGGGDDSKSSAWSEDKLFWKTAEEWTEWFWNLSKSPATSPRGSEEYAIPVTPETADDPGALEEWRARNQEMILSGLETGAEGVGYWMRNPMEGLDKVLGLPDVNYATGGMVPRYAGGGPIMVGETGPEIFVPSSSGRIIANKDLNSRRTRNMLSDWRNRGAGGGSGASVMTVGTLVSSNSISKNSKISIDSYAGVV
jgi:hypothetical protein